MPAAATQVPRTSDDSARQGLRPLRRRTFGGVSSPVDDNSRTPNAGMTLSADGLKLIKSFEGCLKRRPDGSLEAYRCPAGVWTIGWGCTIGVYQGKVVTSDEAESMLKRELGHFEIVVARLVTTPLTQHEFDAITSFAYNCGEGALAGSTLLRELNAGRHGAVPGQLLRWTRGGGQVLNGLVRRRKAEAALFLSGPGIVDQTADYGQMPQHVEPVGGSKTDVIRSSRTFWGTLTAGAAAVANKVMGVATTVGGAATEDRVRGGAGRRALRPLRRGNRGKDRMRSLSLLMAALMWLLVPANLCGVGIAGAAAYLTGYSHGNQVSVEIIHGHVKAAVKRVETDLKLKERGRVADAMEAARNIPPTPEPKSEPGQLTPARRTAAYAGTGYTPRDDLRRLCDSDPHCRARRAD
jgi:lysozyme